MRYVLFKKGPYTSQALESMAFVRTPHCHLPDVRRPIPRPPARCTN